MIQFRLIQFFSTYFFSLTNSHLEKEFRLCFDQILWGQLIYLNGDYNILITK